MSLLLSVRRSARRRRQPAFRPRLELLERRELLASYTTPEDTPLIVSDPNLATLHVVRAPLHGAVVPTDAGGFAYTPHRNYFGADSFTYVLATSAANTSATEVQEANITVTPVNDAPEALPNEYATHRGAALSVAAPGVLKNDKDVDNEVLKAIVVKLPEHGTLVLEENGAFKYTPADGYTGHDSFTYKASDGELTSAETKVFLAVKALPDARDDQYSVAQNGVLTVPPKGVLANDLPLTDFGLVASLEIGPDHGPNHGTVELKADGSFTYKPNANYFGPDSFVYRATDATPALSPSGTTTSPLPPAFDLARVWINVRPTPVVVANADVFATLVNSPLTVERPGVLRNDFVLYAEPVPGTNTTDPATLVNHPLLATLLTNPPPAGLSFKADGGFVYEPPKDFQGTVTFTYQASLATTAAGDVTSPTDPNTERRDIATVTIHVRPAEPRVIARDDEFRTLVGTALSVEAPGVLRNDSPLWPPVIADPAEPVPAGATNTILPGPIHLTAKLLREPQNGTLTLNADGSFKYEPKGDFAGTDTFTYQAIATLSSTDPTTNASLTILPDAPCTLDPNGTANCPPHGDLDDVATVTIVVHRPEPPPGPVARNDFFIAAANTQLSIGAPGVLRNDSPPHVQPLPDTLNTEPVQRPLTAVLVEEPEHGKLVLNANGSFDYEPDPDFVGVDTFVYQASWQHPILDSATSAAGDIAPILSNKATVTIRVAAALAAPDTYSTLQDTELTVPAPGVLGNDAGGSDEHPLEAALVSEPVHGKLELQANGSFVYTPSPGFTGSDVFVYRAETDLGAVDPALLAASTNDVRPITEHPGNVAIVKIHVRAATPTVHAYPDRYVASINTELKIDKPGVLANDYALVNHRVEASLAEGPAHGAVTVNADGSFTYTPATDFVGVDKFVYKATDLDGATSNAEGTVNFSLATVTIHVQADSTLPKFLPGENQRATDESGPQVVTEWATLVSLTGAGQPNFVVSTDRPQLFAALPRIDAAGQLSYTPAPNVHGEAQVTVVLAEGAAADANAVATFTIRIDKPYLLHNVVKRWDVTNDLNVAPDDALAVINYLNAFRAGEIASGEDAAPPLFYDVDKDNFIAPSDALEVINYLNSLPRSSFDEDQSAEGEHAAATDLSLLALMYDEASDATAKRKR